MNRRTLIRHSYKVIYLTGPQAVGKTTLVKRLRKECHDLNRGRGYII